MVTCPLPFVGDKVILGPAKSWVTPPLTACEADITLFEPYGPYTPDAVINEDVEANEAVPNSEPVNPAVAITEVKAASEPDIMTFFQFGIYFFIMVGYIEGYIHFPLGPIIW